MISMSVIKGKDEVFGYLEKHSTKKRIKNNLMPSSKSYLYSVLTAEDTAVFGKRCPPAINNNI